MHNGINYLISLISGVAGADVTINNGAEWWQVLLVAITPTLLTALLQALARLLTYTLKNKGILTDKQSEDIIKNVDKNTEKLKEDNKDNDKG